MKRKTLRIVSCGFLVYILCAFAIAIDGLTENPSKSDVIVVFGNTVNLDGEPSSRLKSRLDRAAELYHQDFSRRIFVSGAVGREGYDEAAVMSKYLISKGVQKADIFSDSQGVNTMRTAENLGIYMRANSLGSAIVVTQFFHVARSKLALKRNGINVVRSAYARYMEARDIYSLAREVPAYFSYLFFRGRWGYS
jgi:vancomycin permeability regulator SanA